MKEVKTVDENNKMSEVWKSFGLETEIGKKLYKMYNNTRPETKINYPKLKSKPKKEIIPPKFIEETRENLSSTAVNSINNPNHIRKPKITQIPKRKPKNIIDQELNEIRMTVPQKPKPGKNREKQIRDLQMKLKRAIDPITNKPIEISLNENEPISQNNKLKILEKKYIFGSSSQLKQEDLDDKQSIEELNIIFEELVNEVEYKQKKLGELEKLGNKKLQNELKMDIIEQISDLQKIATLMKKFKN